MKLRFYIRDIIWLTLLVACNLGWYQHKVAPVKELQKKVGEQHWAIEFHKNQTMIERKAINEQNNNFVAIMQESDRLEKENKELRETVRVHDYKKSLAAYDTIERKMSDCKRKSTTLQNTTLVLCMRSVAF